MNDNRNICSEKLNIGVLTVSDRAHAGQYDDISGPTILDWLKTALTVPYESQHYVVPDEKTDIIRSLIKLCEQKNCHLVFTTGGTGPAPRDITPEATLDVGEREMPGFGERMRAISLQYVPTAILSRQVAVIRKKSLIVNLPGSPKAAKQILDDIFAAIPYCVELIGGPIIKTDPNIVKAFRPKFAPKID